MTILSVFQELAPVTGIQVPAGVFTSVEREHIELTALANEMADRIGKAAEWNMLKTLETITGDGTTTAFSLPSDYDRMPKKQEMRTSRLYAPLEHVIDHDLWLDRLIQPFTPISGSWTMLGGQIHFNPAPTATETVKYYYMSNNWIADSQESKTTFTADDDTFRLGERLLRLGMVWKWKSNKGFPYEEDLADYEQALAEAVQRDKGSRMLKVGRARWPGDVDMAYPKSVTV